MSLIFGDILSNVDLETVLIPNSNDSVKDNHIDWGTGANQVNASGMPIIDASGYYNGEDVESALQDIGSTRVTNWGDGLIYSPHTASVDYNTSNLKITDEKINTIQDITTTSSPTFNQLTINNAPTEDSNAATKNYVDSLVQGLDWQKSVISEINFVTSEPTILVVGNRYINTATGTSSATSQSVTIDYIYEWNGVDWTEIVPDEGFALWVENLDLLKVYDGSNWVSFGSTVIHNNLSLKQGGNGSDEYYHLTNTEYGGDWGAKTLTASSVTDGTFSVSAGTITGVVDLTATGKVVLDGTTVDAALITEVGGELIDFGVNYFQSGVYDVGHAGSMFRIDTRSGSLAAQMFSVIYQATPGTTETFPFQLGNTGNMVLTGIVTAAGVVVGTSDLDLAGNDLKTTNWELVYNATTDSMDWNYTG